jgi:dihydroorotase
MAALLLRRISVIGLQGGGTCDVLISDGTIHTIGQSLTAPAGTEIVEAEGKLLFPGLIDCHVHFRQPGLEHKATMETESRSALAGGVTTVCEMPNTIPPTVTVAALADKVRNASKIEGFDLRFYFGVTEQAHLFTLKELWNGESAELKRLKARCCGVKLYLDHSTGNQKVDGGIVGEIFEACGALGIPIIAHCEDPGINRAAAEANTDTDISAHSRVRPPESEAASIAGAIAMARTSGAALHIAHLSTAQGLGLVRQAKKDTLPVTCEVAPHHLFLSTDDYVTLGTRTKMNPPVRSIEHAEALWKGIYDGTVDCISTDHAPHTIQEKDAQPPLSAPSGVPGVETMLPLLLSVAEGGWPHPGGKALQTEDTLSYADIVRLCFINPNRIFNLGKTMISEGAPADCVVVDPLERWTIRGSELHSKCGWTPYEGWSVTGAVKRVIRW